MPSLSSIRVPLGAATIVLVASTLVACSEDGAKSTWSQACHSNLKGGSETVCDCAFDHLANKFNGQQMNRIPDLLTVTIPQATEMLRESGKDFELTLATRIYEVEDAFERCAKKAEAWKAVLDMPLASL